ncbi:GNAT family N-acetyltransferase [Levilactobacillus bambusae]|uniref:GNAT family N-acetyltransferase n=1 Tax=Levilactobacillus bambusae TaxID=2024736 RepID=A0A2V1N0A3_9LACO|nr:GNAT family N-acetyltransferase [Levilactobacillus bambusae]PWG00492.1 GNAT family N-acetyltransferase [Levilactobacillus bambusae]
MSITIRQVQLSELAVLQAISRETFADTFGPFNTARNIQAYLNRAYSSEQLTTELQTENSKFYFLFVNHQLAGYLKLNVETAQSEPMPATHLEVERIYIRQPFKRQGLGTRLIDFAVLEATNQAKTHLWLGVWEHNDAAQQFYRRMGFQPFSEHVFHIGQASQRDLLMSRRLAK